MAHGMDRRMKAVTDIAGFDFVSHGRKILFDGFRKVWTYGQGEEVDLPELKEGEDCHLKALEKDQKFTSPPPRYSTASLSKLCEKEQIGRPATFANIIKTLKDRAYVVEGKSKSFEPTELGEKVVDFLVQSNVCFVDVKFTAGMEEQLDQIADSKAELENVLSSFWDRLKCDIEHGKAIKQEREVSSYPCPRCGGKLLKKHSQWGAFYVCEHNKKGSEEGCKFLGKIGENGEPVEKVKKTYECADFPCPKCGSQMVKRSGSKGEFYGCKGFPKCRTTANLDGTINEPKKGGRRWKRGRKR